ncbi:hypothetical protein BGW42_006505 [Actinomortierella wolfii]|nr:hypothetical protein BGW42_006505 [Actinomortierella wolfii]
MHLAGRDGKAKGLLYSLASLAFLASLTWTCHAAPASQQVMNAKVEGQRQQQQQQFNNVADDGWLNLTVIHTNDVHARVDPVNYQGVACSQADIASGRCYGGSARHKTIIDGLRQNAQHSLLLDGGDEFQGTLFYTYYKGSITADVLNTLGYDVVTIGNHEWDDGPDNLARYWPKLKMPVVCANIDFSKNPELGKLVKPYHIFEDLKLGVIGYITNTTGDISNAGPTVSFTDPIPVVQKYIDELQAMGIQRILAVSHNGYGPDIELAANTRGLDLIVGGHSHSYLGDPSNPLSEGPYPTVVKNLDGENTLIVQAYCWGRYIGHLDVVFNPEGKIVSWSGQPILVTYDTPPNQELQNRVNGWRQEFEEWGKTVLGVATDDFDVEGCRAGECTMGNLVTDAMLTHAQEKLQSLSIANDDMTFEDMDAMEEGDDDDDLEHVDDHKPRVDAAFINTGGIRAAIPAGNVTIEEILTTSPFGNALVAASFKGKELLDMLDAVLSGRHAKTGKQVTSSIQISGLRYVYNSSLAVEQAPRGRLVTAHIKGRNGKWRVISKDKKYWVVTLDFVLKGGDNLLESKDRPSSIVLGKLDEVLMEYIRKRGTISPYLDCRILDLVKHPRGVCDTKLSSGDEKMERELERHEAMYAWPEGAPSYLKQQYTDRLEMMLHLQELRHRHRPDVGPEDAGAPMFPGSQDPWY